MAIRKDPLVSGQYYHIINRSIAGYKIYNNARDNQRFINALKYYRSPIPMLKISRFLELSDAHQKQIIDSQTDLVIEITAYCIMPTHFHLLIKQNIDNGITKYINNIEISYTRYFNLKYKRKGPLWESKFKNIRVETDEQLLHLTRYIHLNPTSARLVDNPEDWKWSSYHEYIKGEENICLYKDIINITPMAYKEFVNNRKDYQRELSKIKAKLLDDYTG